MEDGRVILDTRITGYAYPATWQSIPIDTKALGGDGGNLHIYWRDCSITFYLWAATNPIYVITPTSPPWHDWTAEYRAIDPTWVDPVLADPLSEHPVRWKNLGFRWVIIGWSASNWTGANKFLQIFFERDRYVK